MRTIAVDDEVFARLEELAVPFVDNEPNDVLRRELGLDGVSEGDATADVGGIAFTRRPIGRSASSPSLEDHLRDVGPHVVELYHDLEDRVRSEASELQLHLTETYIGYRIAGEVRASVVLNKNYLKVLLPLDPDLYAELPQARDITGKGRHGRGDHNLEFSIRSSRDIEAFMDAFGDFFRGVSA